MTPLPSYDSYQQDYGEFQPYQYDFGGYGGPPPPPSTGFRKGFGGGSGVRGGFGGGRPRGGGAPGHAGGKVINSHTSDMDPISMASRIFVGNINTALVSLGIMLKKLIRSLWNKLLIIPGWSRAPRKSLQSFWCHSWHFRP